MRQVKKPMGRPQLELGEARRILNLSITRRQDEGLRRLAEKQGRTPSSVIRELLDGVLEQAPP